MATSASQDPPFQMICFGSIGSIAHCSELQWKYFNAALKEKCESGEIKLNSGDKVDSEKVFWDKETYIASLTSTGGKRRLKAYLETQNVDVKNFETEIESIHTRKTELFVDHIQKGGLTIRPGVLELCKAAKARGIKLAFCTTTEAKVADAFVDCLNLREIFDYCMSDRDLPNFDNKGKPEPDCYIYVVEKMLGKAALSEDGRKVVARVMAIEDTQVSLGSPVAAGMKTIATPSEWAKEQDFSSSTAKFSEVADMVPSAETAGGGFDVAVLEAIRKIGWA